MLVSEIEEFGMLFLDLGDTIYYGMFLKLLNMFLFSFFLQLVSKPNDEYGDTVPSRPHNIGVEGAADLSSHGTMRKLHKVEDVDMGEGV